MLLRFLRGLFACGFTLAFVLALPGLMTLAHANRGRTGIDYDWVDFVRLFSAIFLAPSVVCWYIIVHRILTGRRSSVIIQFFLFAATIWVEYMLLSRGIWI